MTGKTHRAGGMLCSIVGFAILRENGLLLPNVNEGLQLLIMYPFCMWGSIASDLDHHWDSCPQKDYPSWLVHKVLHITAPIEKSLESVDKKSPVYKVSHLLNAKHRSWQTHSDLTLFAMLYLMYLLISGKFVGLGVVDGALLSLVLMGVTLGIIAHFILDMITPEGIWLIGMTIINQGLRLMNPRAGFLPEKLHFVPHKKLFATGGAWECFVQKVLKIATAVAVVWLLVTLFIPNWMSYIPFEFNWNI